MAKFSHLKSLEVTAEKTSIYTIEEIEGRPALHMVHAGHTNAAYLSAQVEWEAAHPVPENDRAAGIAALAAQTRALFPEHIATGWERVKDDGGKDVPYSKGDCREFFAALPDDILVRINLHASTIRNYRANAVTAAAADKVAKNS